ncbi:MAG: tail fiber domain-containing protein, partial [Bacteroidota bacterium]
MKNWLRNATDTSVYIPLLTLVGLLTFNDTYAQVGLRVVNDGVIEKTLTIGQTTTGDSTLNIFGGVQLMGGLSVGDMRDNLFIGANTGTDNTTGQSNTAIGVQSMNQNTTGNNNTAIGQLTLSANMDGVNNTAIGFTAMSSNEGGNANTAIGANALKTNTTGGNNISIGAQSLERNTTASNNIAIGSQSLSSTEIAGNNLAIGFSALALHTSGTQNVAVGHTTLNANTQGFSNTAIGGSALAQNTIGDENVAVGTLALSGAANDEGNKNTAIGFNAFANNDASVGNYINSTAVGANTFIVGSNSTAIGANAMTTQDNEVRIGNDDVTTIGGAVPFTVTSDRRVKRQIRADVPGLAFINLLTPVTYEIDKRAIRQLRGDTRPSSQTSKAPSIRQTGFLAQDVEYAAQQLKYDFSGVDTPVDGTGLYGLRYAAFVVPLVQAVQELSAENEVLHAEKNAQATQIETLQYRLDQMEVLLSQLLHDKQQHTEQSHTAVSTTVITLSDAAVAQNRPNPFRETTTVSYFVPAAVQHAALEVTDANGKLIK